jgi:hypothetical protein
MTAFRPENVLLASETGREVEFLALCDEMAAIIADGGARTAVVDLLAAAAAADLWRFGRASEDAGEIRAAVEAVREVSGSLARRNALMGADERIRMRSRHLEGVQQVFSLRDRLFATAQMGRNRKGAAGLRLVKVAG